MRIILILLRKEFLQVFRNKQMLPIIFIMPLVQLLLLVNAATYEITSADLYLCDMDRSPASRELAEDFAASGFFRVAGQSESVALGEEAIMRRDADVLLVIPNGFARETGHGTGTEVQFIFNAVDGFSAGLIQSYAMAILQQYNRNLVAKVGIPVSEGKGIEIRPAYWYNPELEYTMYMAPGILVVLITMIGLFLSGMNIVKEKEMGTIEQLNVTPIRKYQFIIGKLLPFWILALAELAIGLAIAKAVFDIPLLGLPLVFAMAALYLISVLGLGLLISTSSDTQQQSMFVSWFVMVVFILMSGLFTPIESMPEWAQELTRLNPVRYFIEIMRTVLIKNAAFPDILKQFAYLCAFGVGIVLLAVGRYRKVSG